MISYRQHVFFFYPLLFLTVLLLSSTHMQAQLSGYEYRKLYSVDNTQVGGSGSLTDFPVLINLTDADLATTANSGFVESPNGFDIAFTSDDGTTQLDHELESYDATTGELIAWVRFPTLSATSDTDFYIYFGNASQTTDQSVNTTWDSNFQMVLHLDALTDATANGNDATNNGTSVVTGQIGNARDFTAADSDFLSVADDPTLDITQDLTMSAWVNVTNLGDIPDFFTKGNWDDSYAAWVRGDGTLRLAGDGAALATTTASISSGVSAHVAFTNSATGSNIYINGVNEATGGAGNFTNNNDAFTLSSVAFSLDGWIDELHVSNVSRSGDWILTEYNNQNDPGTFSAENPERPVLSNIESPPQSAVAGGSTVEITDALTITTAFFDSLESATVSITANYDATEDVLAFSSTPGITGSFNSGTGVLTLTGRASVADYQAALRTVTYQNTDGASPSQAARTIEFIVDDIFHSSLAATRDVVVTQTLTELSTDIANTVFHFDAQDVDGDLLTNDQPTDGSTVATWGDRSDDTGGSTTDIPANAPGGDEPLFDSIYFGERGGLFFNFNGGNNGDAFGITNNALVNTNSFTEKSFALVFRTGDSVNGLQFIYEQGGNANGYQISIKDSSLYAYTWSTNATWVDGDDQSIDLGRVVPNESYIVVANHDAGTTTWEAQVNGGSILQSAGAAGDMNSHGGDVNIAEGSSNDPVTFGNPGGGSTYNFDGFIGEFISWNTALSAGQIVSVYDFLCDKWCNEPPVLASIESADIDYTEGDPAVTLTSAITVSDSDNTILDSALVRISTNLDVNDDLLTFVNTASITGSWDAATGELLLTGSASPADYQAALRSVTYENTDAVAPLPGIRQIDFIVYDWDDSSNVQSRNVNVISINSTPTLAGVTGAPVAYNEGDGAVSLVSGITITDTDDTNMESATITISGNYFNGEDVLGFSNTASITSSFNALTGELTLSGTASLADYQTALENVTYENTSSDPIELTRTVSYTVNDGDVNSNTQTRDVTISAANSPPVLSAIESSDLIYPDSPIQITNTLQVTDPDDTSIDSMIVFITSNFATSEDSLLYDTIFGITGNYDTSTGRLTLTGPGSFSDFETAVRSVEYFNFSSFPSGPEREISFLAYDDEGAESDTAKRVIEVNAIESISGLTVWLRADVGVTTSGSEVTAWADQSGNGNDFTGVADAGTRPTFVSSSSDLAGQPAINFAGNGDHFDDPDGDTEYINGLTEFTLFLVYKSDVTGTDRGLWNTQVPDGEDDIFTIRYDAAGANNGGAFTDVVKTGILGNAPANQLESFSDIQTTGAQITSLHWQSGVTYDLYVDGILNNPSAAGPPPTGTISGSTRALVGKGGKDDPDGTNLSWDGLIAEVILYGKNLNTTERESVEDYLSQKYGSAIRKITAATGGEAISADDANTTYTTLSGPTIQEGVPGELTATGTIVLTAPSGYEWNTGTTPTLTITPAYGGTTTLAATFTSISATDVTFTVNTASTTNPGQIEFSGLEVRPTTGVLPNNGVITNTGTTGQGGGTNYGPLGMVPGTADSLSFVQQPSIANVDSTITPSVRVQITDQFGNSVETSGTTVNIAKASGPGNLSGTLTQATNILGIADFADLSLDDVGTYELLASSSGLNSDTSSTFDIVNAGTLTGFTIERFPSGNISPKVAGQTFDIVITAVDGTGTTLTTFNGTVSITSNCNLGTGQGTTPAFASGVLAQYTVSVTNVANCTITATNTAGSQTGVSNSFTVTAGNADVSTTSITANPTVIQNDGSSTSNITVQLKDAFGNDLTSGSRTVALSATDGTLTAVTNNGDGTYTATLTSTTSLVTSTITGTLDSTPIVDDAQVEFASFSHIWESQLGSAADASNWFDTDNWNVGTLPNSASTILIPASPAVGNEFPIMDVTGTTVQSVVIEAGAELSISGSVNFIVTGDFTGNGDILGSNNDSLSIGGTLDVPDITLGTVVFNGSNDQEIISPHEYVDLELDNPTTLSINEDLTVTGTLTLTDGDLIIPSGLNLISTDQSYGTGNLRFQRRISGSRGWRMISSPVNSTFGDLLDETVTQGYSGAFYSTGSNPGDTLQPNVLTYLEDYPGTDNQRFRAPTSSSQNLTEGQGIWVFFFGEIAADPLYNDPLPDTLDVTGQEFEGNGTVVDFGITYTTTADSGWNFIGNPFGATIDWDDNANWTKTNVESTIYIWDPDANSGNGEYLTWNGVTGTLGSGLIAPFQGFWVKANAASPVLSVNENAKTTGGNFLRKELSNETGASPVIELEARANGLSKRTNIMFSEQGQRSRDQLDGLRLLPFSSTHIEFYSLLNDGTQLAINNQPVNFDNRVDIPLILNAFENGDGFSDEFLIRWNGMRGIPDEWIILLIDQQTGERINLQEQQEYRLTHTTSGKVQANTNPYAPNFKMKSSSVNGSSRFTLRITTEEIEARIPEDFYLESNYPNPFNPTTVIPFGLSDESPVRLEIFDILGRKVQTLIDEPLLPGNYNQPFNAAGLASGVYFYRLQTNRGIFVNKMTLIK